MKRHMWCLLYFALGVGRSLNTGTRITFILQLDVIILNNWKHEEVITNIVDESFFHMHINILTSNHGDVHISSLIIFTTTCVNIIFHMNENETFVFRKAFSLPVFENWPPPPPPPPLSPALGRHTSIRMYKECIRMSAIERNYFFLTFRNW